MRKSTRIIGALVIVVILGIGGFSLGHTKGNPVYLVRGPEFMGTYAKTAGAIMLDVRTPEEFVTSHIESAIDVDIRNASFPSNIDALDHTKTYFVYCHSGNRSAQATALMKQKGFMNLYELRGGIQAFPELLTVMGPA